MCDKHTFRFDVDKAYDHQLVSALESSPEHPLSAPEASLESGVYVLIRGGVAVYVGQAYKLRSRLRDHLKKIQNRSGITSGEITCRFLTIERMWEVARAEDALIRHYSPEWNGIPGFSMHVPGYVNEWDRRFPPQK
jgi:hypothetical protein